MISQENRLLSNLIDHNFSKKSSRQRDEKDLNLKTLWAMLVSINSLYFKEVKQ